MTRCYRRVAVTGPAHDKVLQKGGCNRAVRTMTGKAAMLIKLCVLCCHCDHTKSLLSWTSYPGMQHWRSDKGYQEVVGCKVCVVFTVIMLIAATIWASLLQATYTDTDCGVGQ